MRGRERGGGGRVGGGGGGSGGGGGGGLGLKWRGVGGLIRKNVRNEPKLNSDDCQTLTIATTPTENAAQFVELIEIVDNATILSVTISNDQFHHGVVG